MASVVVGLVLLVSGGTKVAAGAAWPNQARQLGAPRWAIAPLPWVEIVVGAAACAQLVRPWPAVAAAALFVAFTALIVMRLREGRHPPCACFGSWSAKPLGWGHVGRNAVFLAVAVGAIVAA
ncbi:MAG TPA: MauE/DoxX family redox-associated membrane protein [Ilumatobacteraceae bacterium]|nr:MauE/DoxX family redox-associated membrane protein [Ilumatobacteraceae bacterium]